MVKKQCRLLKPLRGVWILFWILPLSLHAQSYESFLAQTQNARAQGQYQEALEWADQAIALDPNQAAAWAEKGYAFAHLKRYSDAYQHYQEAIRRGSQEPLVYYNRAWANYNLGRKELACSDWQKALEMGYGKAQLVIQEKCTRK